MAKKNILTRSKKTRAFALIKEKKLEEARELFLQLTRVDRLDPDNWTALGAVYGWLGDHAESESCFRKAISIRPDHAESQYNLGVTLRDQARFSEAIEQFSKAITLEPNYELAYDSLANALVSDNQLKESIEIFREITRRWPHKIDMLGNLATMLQMTGQASEALIICQQIIERNPKFYRAYDVMGSAYVSMGLFDEGVRYQTKSLELQPLDNKRRSNYLLNLNYLPHPDREAVFKFHCEWNIFHAAKTVPDYTNDTDSDRVLRIGYVSPDLREHSVAYFIEPILDASQNLKLESFCYSDMPRPDQVTLRLKTLSHHWCDSHHFSDQQLFDQIQHDQIDILVDLSGHTANSRLKLFSMQPAPVQMTYLGYPNTTGVAGIQYRIVDALTDPDGEERFYTEQLIRLPGCFLCYQPDDDCPDISPIPEGPIVFGSFNNLAKVNDDVIALWAQTVLSVPGSKLLIKNPSLSDQGVCEQYREKFLAQGLENDRVELIGHTATRQQHLELYSRMHIALDTFPYNGTTTTCEALWMGVPVITLVGQYHAGRVGVSLLSAAGCAEWISETEADFIRIAVELSEDLARLSEMRASMRESISASLLCDAGTFMNNLEVAYREVWRCWCEKSADVVTQ